MLKRLLATILCFLLVLGSFQIATAAPLGNSMDKRDNGIPPGWEKMFTGLTLDSASYTLKTGETHATVVKASFRNKMTLDVTLFSTFSSSDTTVATVDRKGSVKAGAPGTAIITAKFLDKTAAATVTVQPSLTGIAFSYKLEVGETVDFPVTAIMSDNTVQDVTALAQYTSSNESVATAVAGKITGIGEGTAIIAASYNGMVTKALVSVSPVDPWTLVWDDEFSGTAVDTGKWNLTDMGGGFGNQEAQYYRPDNATVSDGKLIITAKKENYNGNQYTSAKLTSLGKGDFKYGKIEASIKLPLGQGFWPAFWMMPSNGEYGVWAASGEIDIMEAKGRIPDTVGGTLHYGGTWPSNKYTGKSYIFPQGQTINQFHTYTIEWEPGEMRWYVDGILYQTQTNWNTYGASGEEKYAFPAPFDKEFYIILNLAVGGTFDGGVLPDDSMLPSQMEVDYVRVYELTGRPYRTVVEPNVTAEPLPDGARVPDSTGNYVNDVNYQLGIKDNPEGVDADFGDGWNFIHNAQFGGAATAAVDSVNGVSYAKINVTNPGSQAYSVQMEQHTTLGKGRWYKYSFDAKADKNRTLNTDLGGGPTAGWSKYSDVYTLNLTTDFQHFEKVFQMTKDSDILTRIEFNCATDTGSVWIGNVRLEEVAAPLVDYNATKPALPDSGNLIYNGAFDKYTIDRMSCWNVTKSGATADVSVPEDTRELTAAITSGGTASNALTIDQKGVQLLNGSGYKLSFKARAQAARTIQVEFISKDGATSYLPAKTIDLTTAMQQYDIPFSMGSPADLESQLVFLLGGNDSDVYIDDVSLTKTSIDYSGVDMYPMKNGDFSNGLTSWENWIGEGGAAVVSEENGEAKVSVTGVGNQPWAIQFYQNGFNLVKDMEYTVAFDVRSTVQRNVEFSLENSSYTRYLTAVVAAGPVAGHYEYTFKMSKDDVLTFKFLLGNTLNALSGIGAHDIFIDNVVCEVKDADFITSVTKNGQFKNGLEPWAAWTGDGGAATVTAENEEMKIGVTNAGPNSWSVQVFQEGLNFENGQRYRVSFKARADQARNINVNIGKALTANPWFTPYMPMQTYSLTDTMKEFTYEFTMGEPTYSNAKMVFEAGNVAGGNAPTNIYIDDVAVNKVEVPVAAPVFNPAGGAYDTPQLVAISCATAGAVIRYTTDGTNPGPGSAVYTDPIAVNQTTTIKAYATKDGLTDSDVSTANYTLPHQLLNGTFDTNTDGWGSYAGDGSNATFTVDAGKLKVNFPDYDGWFLWSTQFYQSGLFLEANKTYVLSFDISSTIDKAVQVDIENGADYNIKYLQPQTVNMTAETQTVSIEFTVGNANITNGKLIFMLGSNNVPGELFITHTITLDNVTLTAK